MSKHTTAIILLLLFLLSACSSSQNTAQCQAKKNYRILNQKLKLDITHRCSTPLPKSLLAKIRKNILILELELNSKIKRSAISRLNKYGKVKNVSPHFMHLIMSSKDLYQETHGKFNISLKPALSPSLIKIGMTDVHFANRQLKINIDALSAGLVVDVLADSLTESGFPNHFVKLGSSERWSGVNAKGWAWHTDKKPCDSAMFCAARNSIQ